MTDSNRESWPPREPFDLNDYIGRILRFNDTYGTRPLRCDICKSLTTSRVAMQIIMFGWDGATTQQWGGGSGHMAICQDCMIDLNQIATIAIAARITELEAYPDRRRTPNE